MALEAKVIKKEENSKKQKSKSLNIPSGDFVAPDGGWGWMIVVAAGFSNVRIPCQFLSNLNKFYFLSSFISFLVFFVISVAFFKCFLFLTVLHFTDRTILRTPFSWSVRTTRN